jgi:ribosomal protein S18 acetylase RimI-like enzyme
VLASFAAAVDRHAIFCPNGVMVSQPTQADPAKTRQLALFFGPLVPQYANSILGLGWEAGCGPFWRDNLEGQLARAGTVPIVASLDGREPIGYLQLHHDPPELVIDWLVVAHEYRRHGVGRRLMTLAKRHATECLHVECLRINVWEYNVGAQIFLRSQRLLHPPGSTWWHARRRRWMMPFTIDPTASEDFSKPL